MEQYIAYIWKPGYKTAMLSKDNESFDDFKREFIPATLIKWTM